MAEKTIDSTLIGPLKSEAKVRLVEWDGVSRFQVRDGYGTVAILSLEEARDLSVFIIRHL